MIHDLGIASVAGPVLDRVVVGPQAFDDPRVSISVGVLGAGESTGTRSSGPGREEVWFVLDPAVETTGTGGAVVRTGPGVLAGFSGSVHGLANRGDGPARYIRIAMGEDLAGEIKGSGWAEPEWSPFDRSLLAATNAHDGMGEIRFRRLWDQDRFVTGWGFVDHALVGPGTSVGYHRHDTVQECYLILAGTGIMKVDGAVFEVGPGACVPNRLGGSHGLVAHLEAVEFINVALYTEGRFDVTDLGDDLSDVVSG
ncbi:MAG: cupin domain-containing protein [bacterium]|nr:cupin domain-containing protein [bacterium]MDE0287990.1 cupin domain-containing protein [bacterium]MDE0438073.1 cupin domain-containing protein [bacterium]